MTTHPKRSRPLTRSRRQGFRPEILGLEERTMMASGLTAASAKAARSANEVATSVILGEITTFVAGQPLAASLATRLNRGIKQGNLTRDGAIERIMQTPQVEASLVQSLTEEMLNRAPTPAESRALIAGTRGDGADVPKILVQMMSTPEYYNDQGGTNTGFVQAATTALLNRPASSDELATDVTRLDRGGAAARTQFVQTLTGGREFRLAETQDTYQQFAGTSSTAKEQASALKAFQGPLGYTKMLAQVLSSDATSTGLIPTYAENSGLSVKRVPGFLAGWTVPNLAAPFDVANVANRQIDDKTVDYWAITLNALDAVSLTIGPKSNPTNAGFAVRIWGPDGTEIGAAVTGAQFTFVAKTAGTYTLGVSTSNNTSYAFSPDAKQPAPSVTPVTFTAEFQTYPGANTNTISILLNYKNPAYTANNWPTLTAAQNQAYQTFTTIASAGSQGGLSDFKNFTDFRQVGDITDPETISGWLEATWTPFQTMLIAYYSNQTPKGEDDAIDATYKSNPVLKLAYGNEANFKALVANAFLTDPATQAAYSSVDELLKGADSAREDIYNDFLKNLESWSTSGAVFLGQDATNIATLMTSGLTKVPEAPKPVSPYAGFEQFLSFVVNAASAAVGALADGPLPGSGPVVGAGVYTAGSLLVNLIDTALDGDGGKPPTPPPPTKDITAAATEMDNFALESYKDAFDLLTNQSFLSSVFSNYGLLEAMGTSQFTYALGGQITPASVLKQNYDRSVWEQLLPQMFSWRPVKPADDSSDDGQADTLPNFTFFIPETETATFWTPQSAQPIGRDSTGTEQLKRTLSLPGGPTQAFADARSEIVALQSGTANIPFPGYDLTPSSNSIATDWFGPGPVSIPRPISGQADRFYTISTNSNLHQELFRKAYYGSYGAGGSYQDFYTSADLTGLTIHQWALETPDGNGGSLELSQAAANALFGTGQLTLAHPNPIAYKGGGSYYDFDLPGNGLATRFDVFTQWGKDTPGFAPKSLQPDDTLSGGNMEVGIDPKNYYSHTFYHSYATSYTLKYGASSAKSVRRSSKPPQ